MQFTAGNGQTENTSIAIVAQADVAAGTFTTTNNDLSNRIAGAAVLPAPWTPPTWNNNDAGPAQQTPDLSPLLQELVGLPGWSNASAVVLRFEQGTGHRTAKSFDENSAQAAELFVTFNTSVTATLPVCALPGDARDGNGALTHDATVD